MTTQNFEQQSYLEISKPIDSKVWDFIPFFSGSSSEVSESGLHFMSRVFDIPSILVRVSNTYTLYLGSKKIDSESSKPVVYDPLYDSVYELRDNNYVALVLGKYADEVRDVKDTDSKYVFLTNLEGLDKRFDITIPKTIPYFFNDKEPSNFKTVHSGLYCLLASKVLQNYKLS